jgi:guanylate kinase
MNQLHQLRDFQQALADYQLSEAAQKTLAAVELVMLLGPTGGGRNTIINELVKNYDYYFIVSDTTRQPRANNGVLEQNGREYWFRNEAEMLAEIEAGSFLEAEIIHNQQVSGISMRELAKALDRGKTAIADVDIGGLQSGLKLKPETIAVLIVPPSFSEWQQRLGLRGDMPSDERKRRMETALDIFKMGTLDESFSILINDSFVEAAERIQQLVQGATISLSERQQSRLHCQQLLDDTRAFISRL